MEGGRPYSLRRHRETRRDPARSATPRMHGSTLNGSREIPRLSAVRWQTASGSPKTHADDERTREVGQLRTTAEAAEQRRATGRGGGRGKGAGQGEPARTQGAPDPAPDRCAQRARASTSGCTEGQEAAVHRAPASRLCRDTSSVGLLTKKVNWVLDADIRGFFDNLVHGWLVKFIEHRVADRRVVRLIQKWLNAGVLEDGKRMQSEVGAVQGGSVSPLLANVYLHYVFDLWVQRWRKAASGDVIIVRFADDFVLGFQHRYEAEQFLDDLRERFAKFGLELHPDKTRLIEFGRYATQNRTRRGGGKP